MCVHGCKQFMYVCVCVCVCVCSCACVCVCACLIFRLCFIWVFFNENMHSLSALL